MTLRGKSTHVIFRSRRHTRARLFLAQVSGVSPRFPVNSHVAGAQQQRRQRRARRVAGMSITHTRLSRRASSLASRFRARSLCYPKLIMGVALRGNAIRLCVARRCTRARACARRPSGSSARARARCVFSHEIKPERLCRYFRYK